MPALVAMEALNYAAGLYNNSTSAQRMAGASAIGEAISSGVAGFAAGGVPGAIGAAVAGAAASLSRSSRASSFYSTAPGSQYRSPLFWRHSRHYLPRYGGYPSGADSSSAFPHYWRSRFRRPMTPTRPPYPGWVPPATVRARSPELLRPRRIVFQRGVNTKFFRGFARPIRRPWVKTHRYY